MHRAEVTCADEKSSLQVRDDPICTPCFRCVWSLNKRGSQPAKATEPGEDRGPELWSELFAKLDTVHQLPDDQTRSPKAKADLAMVVFESAPRVANPEVARMVCAILAEQLVGNAPKLSLPYNHNRNPLADLQHNLRPLLNGLKEITARALKLRKETGLDVEPGPALIDFVVEQQAVRSLLQELVLDDELSGLSQLARNLSAVVQLPRAILDSDELPLGGVSDLTNRGTLDRMLLSELAHDDLMLATRVALNEALYLRREVQPGHPSERCHVLIDSGLRMWGVPRVFATAVALSLASTRDPQSSLSAYRASEASIIPVDLSTREGLIAHLGALEPDVQPGRALPEFFARISQSKFTGDAVLVTTEMVLNDPEFQRALAGETCPRFYLATVNREGEFQLCSHGPRGRKCHTSLKLDLNQILNAPAMSDRNLIDSTVDPNLPALFRVHPFPFRLPGINKQSLVKDNLWSFPIPAAYDAQEQGSETSQPTYVLSVHSSDVMRCEYGIVALSRDQRLVLIDDPARGARQIHESIPFGKLLTSWSSVHGRVTSALLFRESQRKLYIVSIDRLEGTATHHALPSAALPLLHDLREARGATYHQGVLFLVFRELIEAFDPTTRQLLATKRISPSLQWRRGRYFWDAAAGKSDACIAIAFDGTSIITEPVPLGQFATVPLLTLFDRQGYDGAFGIDREGHLLDVTEQTKAKLWKSSPVQLTVMEISEDGRRMLVSMTQTHSSKSELALVDVASLSLSMVARGATLAEVDAYRVSEPPHIMRRFTSIAIQGDKIVLVSKRGNFWSFKVYGDRLSLQEVDGSLATRLSRNFELMNRSPNHRLQGEAKWDDGSRAWLDARGILHLQSSDRSIPEVSLVLSPPHVAVWTSDRRANGTRYFLDAENSITAEEIVTNIFEPFVAQLT
ncbi:hypothetical protein [Schlesneria paludicola]|uniref:hypothetical protein n=1 Tax=Schlesneria paludicola TaxID=360056 RepID=UPI00029B4A40|nr:hypothetical protein [Schlesneria paludicola]